MGRKDKAVGAENVTALTIGARMRYVRQRSGVNLTEMARQVGYSKSYLSAVENNATHPSQQLLSEYERVLGLERGELAESLRGQEIPRGRRRSLPSPVEAAQSVSGNAAKYDLEEIPYIESLYGREEQLELLTQWIVQDRCRLVAVLGIGGMGKTALVGGLVRDLKQRLEFEGIVWISLQSAPSLEYFLERCLQSLYMGEGLPIPEEPERRLRLLYSRLQERRFLLVLDNFDSLLKSGSLAGEYRDDRLGYEDLLYNLGIRELKSCVILTSREKPGGIPLLEGRTAPVRSMTLPGIDWEAARLLLEGEGLEGDDDDWRLFVERYSGNPLALKLVSPTIREVFNRKIGEFLQEHVLVLDDIQELLDQQFDRLSPAERHIMYWLAIGREVVTLDELLEDSARLLLKKDLLQLLKSLRHRSLVEVPGPMGYSPTVYKLQPVIQEYVTEKVIKAAAEEIKEGRLALLNSHALMKAQAEDYVREDQQRSILEPLAVILRSELGAACEERLKSLLASVPRNTPGYAASNILHLMIHLQCNLQSCDFSERVVWQAYLRGKTLHRVNFSGADLARSVFTDTFGSILSVALSADGRLLALGTTTCEVRVFLVKDNVPLVTCQGHADWVRAVVFSTDGSKVISGSEDQTIRIWDAEAGQCLRTLSGHSGRVYTLAISPDGELIASGSADQTVRIWRCDSGECLHVLPGHTGWVYAVTFSHDGRTLISGGEDQTVRFWDVSSGSSLRTVDTYEISGRRTWIWSLALSPDDRWLACGGEDQIVLWDRQTHASREPLSGHRGLIYALAFLPDGRRLVSAGGDEELRLWDLTTGELLQTFQGHNRRVYSLALSTDGQTLVSGSDDQTVRFWDVKSARCTRTLQGHSSRVSAITFSNDGERVASGSDDSLLRLWDVSSHRCLKTLQGHTGRIWSVAFSPDDRLLVSGSEDQTIRLWDVESGQCLKVLQGHTGRVYMVSFTPDGTRIVSGSVDQAIRIWDITTGQCLQVLVGHERRVYSALVSPDGRWIISGGEEGDIRIWDAVSGELLRKLEGHTARICCLVISPDGTLLASGGADQAIRLWDITSGQLLDTLYGHQSTIWSLVFSPDGTTLVSGGDDQTIRIWDVASRTLLRSLPRLDFRIRALAYGPHSRVLVCGGYGGTIDMWDLSENRLLGVFRSDRPYEGMNIKDVRGLSFAQKAILRSLGAIEA